MVREGVPLELNEFDAYAVAEAIRLRDEHGGEVVTMTMGPPQAEDALRMTLAIGADRAIHLSDRVFAVADTLGTSRTLAMAIAQGGRRPGALRPQDARLRDLAGAARGRRLPRLAPADERRPRSRSTDGKLRARRRDRRGRGARTSSDLPAARLGRGAARGRRLERRADVDRGPRSRPGRPPTSSTRSQRVDKRFGQTGLADAGSRGARRVARADAASFADPAEAAATRAAAAGRAAAPETPPGKSPSASASSPAPRYDCWSVVETRRRPAARASRSS